MSKNNKNETNSIALGISLGLPLGLLFGMIILDNPILGLSFGMLFGVGIGGLFQADKNKKNKSDKQG